MQHSSTVCGGAETQIVLGLKCWQVVECFSRIANGGGMGGVVLLEQCCANVAIPLSWLPQLWVRIVIGLFSPQRTILQERYVEWDSDFSWNEMLADYWVLLGYNDGMVGVMMLWEWFEAVDIPPYSLQLLWATMVSLAYPSTQHSSTLLGDSDFTEWNRWLIAGYLWGAVLAWIRLCCYESVMRLL